jgi:hypothetical protein
MGFTPEFDVEDPTDKDSPAFAFYRIDEDGNSEDDTSYIDRESKKIAFHGCLY